jgi:hypothetical protein
MLLQRKVKMPRFGKKPKNRGCSLRYLDKPSSRAMLRMREKFGIKSKSLPSFLGKGELESLIMAGRAASAEIVRPTNARLSPYRKSENPLCLRMDLDGIDPVSDALDGMDTDDVVNLGPQFRREALLFLSTVMLDPVVHRLESRKEAFRIIASVSPHCDDATSIMRWLGRDQIMVDDPGLCLAERLGCLAASSSVGAGIGLFISTPQTAYLFPLSLLGSVILGMGGFSIARNFIGRRLFLRQVDKWANEVGNEVAKLETDIPAKEEVGELPVESTTLPELFHSRLRA